MEQVVPKVVSLGATRRNALNRRVSLVVELPQFVLRALEYRVAIAHESAEPDETVSLNDVVEWYLVSPLTMKEVPHVEAAVPGFSAALAHWIVQTNYQPPDD